ncbi:hypothetical protein BDM02DRAFT_380982 [Thelephora ganbajun]|uniref:Uncharacterized protein n=1 Tax=Thelephora ganbajun TaxID=370292 RepID=A0ACB6Z8B4_THEGA|nr:hypothetical protein BDM02DRAFT_380982 [Thelephora ganbajun]
MSSGGVTNPHTPRRPTDRDCQTTQADRNAPCSADHQGRITKLAIPPLAEPEKSRRSRKRRETKRFVPASRKSKSPMWPDRFAVLLRTKNQELCGFLQPFGPDATPGVDVGTLEEALRTLGLESGSV